MATLKPDIVVVHAAWHLPAAYGKFCDLVKSRGLTIHVPELPSMNGDRPPTADLATDTEFIRNYIVTNLLDVGRSVVVLMHSYGGQVGTNALFGLGTKDRKAQGLPGGVSQLVYISAAASLEGESMIDQVKRFGHMDLMPLAFDYAEDGTCVDRNPKDLVVGPGLSESELEDYVSGLTRWNGVCLYQAVDRCAWRKIPMAYVYSTNDMTLPFDYQKHMVETVQSQGVEVQTFTLETGHCPNITKPDELAEIIEKVLESM
ncbi:alpha/beta-hydrolase [Penicillium angulare]|uniref:Alpha/beta-hydrolase n=1 Tax=Penicillium angulare TaxID=116970 RepID=A0A9W9FZ26_9EURO|nr:alpha/beta-hydrolase [Penicillium angulare]